MKHFPVPGLVVPVLCALLLGSGCGDQEPRPAPAPSASVTPALVPLVGDGFRVSLPGPTKSTRTAVKTATGEVPAQVYATQDDPDGSFLVTLVSYPAGSAVDLDAAVQGIASGYAGTVLLDQQIELQGRPGRQVRVEGTNQGQPFTFYALVADLDGKLFQLIFAVKGSTPPTPPAVLGEVANTLTFG